MFPIAIVAGVIGAAVSVAQGASWVQNHVGPSGSASSVGGKSDATSQTSGSTSASFDAVLAAQAAGQSVPTSTTSTPVSTSSALTTQAHQLTSYDTLERTKAGVAAYSHAGQHRNSEKASESGSVTRS
jgi:hypothetical protein